ncbi:MipA/OmpV family protein [Kordiimonas pumila]|uniref:MipA/OmpV family protein n=1 Tax=Kordiimonas pumila TaxID=2161677 RepID=A0ABV7D059_9PROT|nr:MipA/OmpV family protein [Kordiimonas pumila]
MIKYISLSIFSVVAFASPASAQTFVTDAFNNAVEAVQSGLDLIWPDDVAPDEINARLGVGFGFTPDYTGSDNYRFRIVPLIDIRYKDAWRLNGSLLTFKAYENGNFEAGPLLALSFGRDESNNPVLAGIGDISDTFEVGVFAHWKTKSALLSAEYRHGLGAGIGSSVRLTAGHGVFRKDNFVAMLVGRAKWISDKSAQTIFGITPQQSASSEYGLAAFNADSGFSEVSASIVGSLTLSEKVRVLSLLSYGRILGSPADSPLVTNDRGSKAQMVAGAGIAYNF